MQKKIRWAFSFYFKEESEEERTTEVLIFAGYGHIERQDVRSVW